MLPACRTGGEGFVIPTFDLVPSDVDGFMEELWAFQSAFHDCFARSEPRAISSTIWWANSVSWNASRSSP